LTPHSIPHSRHQVRPSALNVRELLPSAKA
jgi:hypothetical protein